MSKPKPDAKAKGDFLEEVVALLHEGPGWTVERNVRVPIPGQKRHTREIDILISGSVAAYPVRIAIECKNWGRKVEAPDLDGFVGKLGELGIPGSCGVYVSAHGYTKGGVRRALRDGIQPLEIVGLSKDRLGSAIEKAFQHVIYLVPTVDLTQTFDDKEENSSVIRSLRYKDPETGKSVTALDHLWKKWFFGELPLALGLQHHSFDLPQDPALFQPGEEVIPKRIFFGLQVQAAVVSVEGDLTSHALRHSSTKTVERQRMFFDFTASSRHTIRFFDGEDDLKAVLKSNTSANLTVGRVPLPRIIYQHFYWPPTRSSMQRAAEIYRRGQVPTFEEVESFDLSRAWAFLAEPADLEFIRDDQVTHKSYP